MVALVRTELASENRHAGMSQVIVDLQDKNVTVSGIKNLSGEEDFNQVFFDDVFIPDDRVVGQPGNGWEQVISELGYERSGPERFLSAFRVLVEYSKELAEVRVMISIRSLDDLPRILLPCAGCPFRRWNVRKWRNSHHGSRTY